MSSTELKQNGWNLVCNQKTINLQSFKPHAPRVTDRARKRLSAVLCKPELI